MGQHPYRQQRHRLVCRLKHAILGRVSTLVRITREQRPDLWPAVVDRITAFSLRYGAKPTAFVNNLWTLFATQSPLLGIWIALPDASACESSDARLHRPIGHIVTTIEPFNGATVAWVQQCEMDTRTPQAFVDAFLLELEAWITAANAVLPPANKVTETLFMTTRDTEVWTRRAGFDLHRTIYRRPVR